MLFLIRINVPLHVINHSITYLDFCLDPKKEETQNLFKEKEMHYCLPEDTKEKTQVLTAMTSDGCWMLADDITREH